MDKETSIRHLVERQKGTQEDCNASVSEKTREEEVLQTRVSLGSENVCVDARRGSWPTYREQG